MSKKNPPELIPAIDLFAGPGGLAEGFSHAGFEIRLSIEMDEHAHRTLRFRSFCRKLIGAGKKDQLYEFFNQGLKTGDLDPEAFGRKYPELWDIAESEAMRATLGKTPEDDVSNRIEAALGDSRHWILLGGPPCQAYSLVGRAKMKGTGEKFEKDHRHLLYREYLRIVASHAPSIFVMENVKGLLSSSHKGKAILGQIMADLKKPRNAIPTEQFRELDKSIEYDLFPLWEPQQLPTDGNFSNKDFIVHSEDQGLPQARHRLFIVGLRRDLGLKMSWLKKRPLKTRVEDVLRDLPKLHCQLSKEKDRHWIDVINEFPSSDAGIWLKANNPEVWNVIHHVVEGIEGQKNPGANVFKRDRRCRIGWNEKWYRASNMPAQLNHESRGHMPSDIHRYLFCSSFAEVHGTAPKLTDFPPALLPNHKNVDKKTGDAIFADRFRVQCKDRPSTTITSHIHKDGHYFIHYDSSQCRSLTVREAARLQTFPDDYLFCGKRTEQFKQVGNAVPPFLAFQIGEVVKKIMATAAPAR